jgi:hypothetical protein
VGTRLLRPIAPLIIFSLVGLAGAFVAYPATKPATKTTPTCKTGQKSTIAHPCFRTPICKTGQKSTKARPCVPRAKVASTTTTTTKKATTTTAATPAPAPGPVLDANGCPAGQNIPQGAGAGDGDGDNNGGPSDGDGCL